MTHTIASGEEDSIQQYVLCSGNMSAQLDVSVPEGEHMIEFQYHM